MSLADLVGCARHHSQLTHCPGYNREFEGAEREATDILAELRPLPVEKWAQKRGYGLLSHSSTALLSWT